ncbi:hypothetical protein [Treponema putidum]|uniref:Tetratricopeptide repeat protein n=1 Tax=Treponema putidum TaxID=221027 RepID=A0ABY5HXD1_9SPIR|nr:hypothetical protein [Treponema putidum]UTY28830.1 hypothetical protein E4N76_07400 [Treponema putidum]UTY31253.1 hypothetical protein E4N75_06825 [Treponema putidum]
MKERKVFITELVFFIICAALFYNIYYLKVLDIKLSNIEKEFENRIANHTEKSDSAYEKLNKDIEKLYEELKDTKIELTKFLNSENKNLYVKMDNILKNQKDLKSDKEKQEVKLLYAENYLSKKEGEAYILYKEGKYARAYKIFSEIIESDPERLTARYYAVYCRFYSNPLDIESYKQIEEEIKYLKSQGINEVSLYKIEEAIKLEREALIEK